MAPHAQTQQSPRTAASARAPPRTAGRDAGVDMGWGRLFFGHTYRDHDTLVEALRDEAQGQRNIALYVPDPHVVLSLAPQDLFLDPSHTYRLRAAEYRFEGRVGRGVVVRHISSLRDARAAMRIFAARQMVTCDPAFLVEGDESGSLVHMVAESEADGSILGTVTGVDHVAAFGDPEGGSSLWCLAVDPQAAIPGVGALLVRHLAEHMFRERGLRHVDLSVMHDNEQAICLYEKLGFRRIEAYCLKRKNPINEPLFVPDHDLGTLNPYAQIIVDEARRRGIRIERVDDALPLLRLHLGGRTVTCWESLTDRTSAIAFARCDDKRLTHRVLAAAGLHVPAQVESDDGKGDEAFLAEHRAVVVKPARGEQGAGVSVDVRDAGDLRAALKQARRVCRDVVLESYHEGQDLRIIVIADEVVAAAVRRPPVVVGTGEHTVLELIEKYNRRRAAATGGESHVPLDDETARCVRDAGHTLESVLASGETVTLRKAANLHTGGTIHDVTEALHPALADAAVAAARAIEIPVVGLDLLVPAVAREEYVIIEANERPGLANHEPAPTAERFLDFLFPRSRVPASS